LEKAKLTDIEKGVLILRLGADGGDCRSLREIAKMCGMSYGKVAAIERKAICKLAERSNRTFDDAWELYRVQRIACDKHRARSIFR